MQGTSGAALASYFSGKGLHVFIAGRSEDKLQRIAENIRQQGGCATTVVADATVEQDVAQTYSIPCGNKAIMLILLPIM